PPVPELGELAGDGVSGLREELTGGISGGAAVYRPPRGRRCRLGDPRIPEMQALHGPDALERRIVHEDDPLEVLLDGAGFGAEALLREGHAQHVHPTGLTPDGQERLADVVAGLGEVLSRRLLGDLLDLARRLPLRLDRILPGLTLGIDRLDDGRLLLRPDCGHQAIRAERSGTGDESPASERIAIPVSHVGSPDARQCGEGWIQTTVHATSSVQ